MSFTLLIGGLVLLLAVALGIGALIGHTMVMLLYPLEPRFMRYPDLTVIAGLLVLGLILVGLGML